MPLERKNKQTNVWNEMLMMYWGACTSWGRKLLCGLLVRQQILLFLLPGGSGVNRQWPGWLLSFSVLCADISLHGCRWCLADGYRWCSGWFWSHSVEPSCPGLYINLASLGCFQSGCFLLRLCKSTTVQKHFSLFFILNPRLCYLFCFLIVVLLLITSVTSGLGILKHWY